MTISRLFKHRTAVFGGICLFVLVLMAVGAPWLSPQDPLEVNLIQMVSPGFWSEEGVPGFPLGTDHLGRDVLSRVLFGARISLIGGIGPVLLSTIGGFLVGSFVLFSSRLDSIAMRLMDVLFAFPSLLLAMTLVAVLGPGLVNAIIAIAIVDTPRMARVVRGQMLALKDMEYMQAQQALGATRLRMLFRHALPNVAPVMIVYASLMAGRAILTVAGLSYLGLGAQPPLPEWGSMLSESRELMLLGGWWAVALPGTAILLAVLSFNMLGDGLRDALDPRQK